MWWLAIVIIVAAPSNSNASILDYVWSSKQATHVSTDLNSLPQVPYEIADKDNRFLEEASKLVGINLSHLDLCHHRVILTLKKSCNDLNSEQIGKLAVMLLNCQSGSEGRKLFKCTEEMSLKQCTTDMDSDTWNAYHLVTNRAKAVCASVRQEQFRGLTELTVNKLMNTAHDQIQMMQELGVGQKRLHEMTDSAMAELSEKNTKLLDQQHNLLSNADQHRHKIEENFQELVKERGLIRSGHQQVAILLADFRARLEDGLKQLDLQTQRSKINHASLLDELEGLQASTNLISTKIESTADHILVSLEQLERINQTIFGLAHVMQGLQTDFNGKLTWISKHIGNSDEALNQIYITVSHVAYLLMGMLCLAFVSADKFTRLFFIFAVPTNLVARLTNFYGQDVVNFTAILVSVFAAHWIANYLIRWRIWRLKRVDEQARPVDKLPTPQKITSPKSPASSMRVPTTPSTKMSVHDISRDTDTDNEEMMSFMKSYQTPSSQPARNVLTPIPKRLLNESMGSESGRSYTPFSVGLAGRIQCNGQTQKNQQCRNAAVPGENYCRMHNQQSSVRRD